MPDSNAVQGGPIVGSEVMKTLGQHSADCHITALFAAGKSSARMGWAPASPDTPTPSHSPVNGPADGNVCLF